MVEAGEREEVASRTLTQVTELAQQARGVGLDTLAYLLDIVGLEARQHLVIKGSDPPYF